MAMNARLKFCRQIEFDFEDKKSIRDGVAPLNQLLTLTTGITLLALFALLTVLTMLTLLILLTQWHIC